MACALMQNSEYTEKAITHDFFMHIAAILARTPSAEPQNPEQQSVFENLFTIQIWHRSFYSPGICIVSGAVWM